MAKTKTRTKMKAKSKQVLARISDANPKNSSGNYARLFGDEELGNLISKIQSASIKAGYVLEEIITQKSTLIPNEDLDRFVDDCMEGKHSGIFLCTKRMIKESNYRVDGHEPDLMIFSLNSKGRGICHIVELKVGAAFDTKKADGEKETLEICRSALGPKLPFITNFYLCAFHAEDRQEIVTGLKGRFTLEEVMTGRELCEILSIDYDEVVEEESRFQRDNAVYFTRAVVRKAKEKMYLISEEDFYGE
ncbi:MAG: hypothetical protein IJP91_07860 [Synergistaceae bacterium]|nr:hypothetical protein [Synergistaceae bacterium]